MTYSDELRDVNQAFNSFAQEFCLSRTGMVVFGKKRKHPT